MKAPRNYVILGLVVLLGGTGALLSRQFLATEELKARVFAAENESAQQKAARDALAKKAPAAKAPATDPPKESTDAPEGSAPNPADRAREAANADGKITADKLKQWLADANDPAVMRRLNTQARNQTLRRYSALFTQLNLPAEQTEAFTKLLTDKRQAAMDIIVTQLQQGNDPTKDMDEFRNQLYASRGEIENQVHALLGDAGYAQYQAYDQDFSHQSVLTNLQGSLVGTAEPLTPEQASRMTQLLEQTNAGHITPEVITGAKDFLSPTQLQALQDLRAIFLANAQKRLQPGQILPTAPVTGETKP